LILLCFRLISIAFDAFRWRRFWCETDAVAQLAVRAEWGAEAHNRFGPCLPNLRKRQVGSYLGHNGHQIKVASRRPL
jgi:hypothetical protein